MTSISVGLHPESWPLIPRRALRLCVEPGLVKPMLSSSCERNIETDSGLQWGNVNRTLYRIAN